MLSNVQSAQLVTTLLESFKTALVPICPFGWNGTFFNYECRRTAEPN
jgi:hypothetical protein